MIVNFLFVSYLPYLVISLGAADYQNLTVNLTNDGVKEKIIISANSSILIHAYNIPTSVSFLIFQVHSQVQHLTLSKSSHPSVHNKITGTNIGLVYILKDSDIEAEMWLFNYNQAKISLLLIILAFEPNVPLPGGCNMEFPTEIAPYMRIKNDYLNTYLEYQHANIGPARSHSFVLCSETINFLSYDIYSSFLKENDYGEQEYFQKISLMANLSYIKQYSTKVKTFSVHPNTRFIFFKYPNLGVIYNIIAKYTMNGEIKESPYIPVATYGCDFSSEFGCWPSYSIECKAILFILSIFGFIIAFFGNEFLKVELFFFGFVAFTFIGFIILAKFSNFTQLTLVQLSVLIGLFGGFFNLCLWLKLSILSFILIGLCFGFLFSSTILFTPLGNEIFLTQKNFWLLLSTGTLFTTVIFLAYPTLLSIVASSFVGSYVTLLFYDDFIGTRLSYIVLNIVKRAVSDKFSIILNNYPHQARDIFMFTAWCIVSIFALIVQSKRHFHCRNAINCMAINLAYICLSKCFSKKVSSNWSENESTLEPLLGEQISSSYETFSN